ncbi:MFS transporter [Nocardioides yefusunii]|uniref:MFS transporter n=1 Tax=Nocardioides yefusunii TaxID=2500546 RepID=A0ABW1QZY3_9ACTN|nr:MFS transporter [Nocardioides yefusunii]
MSSRIWTRDFSLAVVTNTFVSLVFYLLMSGMTLYAVEQFAASDTLAGLTSSMFVIGSVAARVYAGKLLDVVGRRRMLVVAMVVYVVCSVLYTVTDQIGLLLLVRFVHGMAFGAGNTSVAASVQSIIPPERRSEGTGYFGLSTTVAMAVGPLLAVTLSAGGHWDALFWSASVASLVAFGVSLVLRLPEREVGPEERHQWWRLRITDVFDAATMPIAVIMLLSGIAYSSILSFLASYGVAEGMSGGASAFFIVYALAVLVSRLVVGRIQDRLGDNAVMYPTMVSFVLALFVIGWAPNGLALALAGVLGGFGFGAMMSCAQAIVASRATPARIGVVTSTFFILLDVGCGLGPVALGSVVGGVGYRGMYLAMSVLMILTIALYWFLHGRAQGAPRTAPSAATVSEAGTSAVVGRRVLVGFDGSADGLRALRYAANAANVAGYDLWVVSAVTTTATGGDFSSHIDAADVARQGGARLDAARALLTEMRFPAEQTVLEVVTAHPVVALTERSGRAVLMVLGRRSSSGLERMFVGSTSLGVVAGAKCPVVVISAASTPHLTDRNGVVTVAVGARGGDRGSISWGLAEARRRHASLRVVHVTKPGDDEAELRERALARLEELSPGYPDVELLVDLPRATGRSAVDELVEISRSSDLLVLDARGNRVTGLPMGGAVRGVLAHAECPVVLAG